MANRHTPGAAISSFSESGLVTTGAGDPVLGEGGPLTLPPADKISIARDGGVWILPQGDTSGEMQQIDRLALVSFTGSNIIKGNDNLFRVKDGGILPADPDARLIPASLEGSNVNMTHRTHRYDRSKSRLGNAGQAAFNRARIRQQRRQFNAATRLVN